MRSSSNHFPETAVIRHPILLKRTKLGAKIVALILGQQEDLRSDVLLRRWPFAVRRNERTKSWNIKPEIASNYFILVVRTLELLSSITRALLKFKNLLFGWECRYLRTFARKFSNVDFCLKILPLKDDELVMSEMYKKMGGHQLRFGENMLGRTPKSE